LTAGFDAFLSKRVPMRIAEARNAELAEGVEGAVKLLSDVFLVFGGLLFALTGCSGAEPAKPPSADMRAQLTELLTAVSARCPDADRARSPEQPPARDQLFVEAAILEVSSAVAAEASLANLHELPQMAQVQMVAVPHVIADFEHRAEMDWGPGAAERPQVSLRRWSLLPRRADDVTVLDVELELEPPTSKPGPAVSGRPLKFSATVRENEPALARVEWDAASQRSLLILFRTFAVHGEQDLRAIFECKMQQRAQALRSR
jgi:hypothetical protein